MYLHLCHSSLLGLHPCLPHSRLLLLNIKLAISNMFRYAMRRKVSLPGDDEQEDIDVSSASIPGEIQSSIFILS